MEIYYINSEGRRIDLIGGNYKLMATSELFDYSWQYATKGSAMPEISSFSKKMVEKTLQIGISAKSKEEYYTLISNLLSTIDRDIYYTTPGKLYVNGTYLRCYFIGSSKAKRYANTQRTVVDFTILCEKNEWVEERKNEFGAAADADSDAGLDYQYDYQYDFTNTIESRLLQNTGYVESDMIMTIYGPCDAPKVTIGTSVYKVNTSLISGEYLEINTETRSIYKTMNNGTKVNLFDDRDRENNIFSKVPEGKSVVARNGAFRFDITLLIKRSEPKWI